MSESVRVVQMDEYEAILAQIVELLKCDPDDVQAANFILTLVEQQKISTEIAHRLYREAVLRVYLGNE